MHTANALHGVGKGVFHLQRAADVTGDGERAAADLDCRVTEPLGRTAPQGDHGALSGEGLRDGPVDAERGACDDRRLSPETHCAHVR